MRLFCNFCGKSVTNEVSHNTIVRAVLVCPECIEVGRIIIADPGDSITINTRVVEPIVEEIRKNKL